MIPAKTAVSLYDDPASWKKGTANPLIVYFRFDNQKRMLFALNADRRDWVPPQFGIFFQGVVTV